jgi:hypothetical protein
MSLTATLAQDVVLRQPHQTARHLSLFTGNHNRKMLTATFHGNPRQHDNRIVCKDYCNRCWRCSSPCCRRTSYRDSLSRRKKTRLFTPSSQRTGHSVQLRSGFASAFPDPFIPQWTPNRHAHKQRLEREREQKRGSSMRVS